MALFIFSISVHLDFGSNSTTRSSLNISCLQMNLSLLAAYGPYSSNNLEEFRLIIMYSSSPGGTLSAGLNPNLALFTVACWKPSESEAHRSSKYRQ